MQQKASSFWGASPPRPPDQGLCPWTPLEAQPPDPQHLPPMLAISPKPRVSG